MTRAAAVSALELRIPPLILLAVAGVVLWLVSDIAPGRLTFPGQDFAAGSLAFVGVLFCSAGMLALRRFHTTVNPMQPVATSTLVTSGLYRLSRNPMYVGFGLLLAGWGVFLGNPLAVLIVGVFVAYLNRFQILPEERALRGMFGMAYETYCREVRRWL